MELEYKVRAPAKLILSGEHAVVYGKPALAVAIDRFIESAWEFQRSGTDTYTFYSAYFPEITLTDKALASLKLQTQEKYQAFKQQLIPIEQVLTTPQELMFMAVADVLQSLKGISFKVKLSSTIPLGCGLGSSAALLINILFSLNESLQLGLKEAEIRERAIALEHLQHGKSSGLDVHVCHLGGCLFFQHLQFVQLALPPLSLYLIDTGRPASSTGMAVAHVSKHREDVPLWNAFEAVTKEIDQALQNGNKQSLYQAINENHRLLNFIGVVPKRVHDFVLALQSIGVAAKLSGAGAVKGDCGGVVLAFADDEIALRRLSKAYGYEVQTVNTTSNGVHRC